METTIQKWGNSKGIRIPKQILKELGLNDGSKVDVIRQGDHIEIKKLKRKNIFLLLKGIRLLKKVMEKLQKHQMKLIMVRKKGLRYGKTRRYN